MTDVWNFTKVITTVQTGQVTEIINFQKISPPYELYGGLIVLGDCSETYHFITGLPRGLHKAILWSKPFEP